MSDTGTPVTPHYGALIRVRDMAVMRHFYGEVLGLGDPVVDSNFWVEFALPGNGILALCQQGNAKIEDFDATVSWLLYSADFDGTLKAMQEADVPQVHPTIEIPGRRCATFADPEKNAFSIYG